VSRRSTPLQPGLARHHTDSNHRAAAAVLVAAPLAYYLLRPLPYEDDNVTFVPNSPSDSRKRDTPQQTSQAGGSPPVKRGKKHDNPYAQELGAGPEESQTATSREGTRGTQSGDIAGKQFGISTGRTRHSMPIDQGDDKSKKSTGEPETAKAQGTVPVRPPH